jgi:hypothetical protein
MTWQIYVNIEMSSIIDLANEGANNLHKYVKRWNFNSQMLKTFFHYTYQ